MILTMQGEISKAHFLKQMFSDNIHSVNKHSKINTPAQSQSYEPASGAGCKTIASQKWNLH